MEQNKDAVWPLSLLLLIVTGVRADPKYSYSYEIVCMYVRIVTFDFSLRYVFHLFSQHLVVGIWYDFFFGFNNMRRNTCRSDFSDTKRKRENSRAWPFEGRC